MSKKTTKTLAVMLLSTLLIGCGNSASTESFTYTGTDEKRTYVDLSNAQKNEYQKFMTTPIQVTPTRTYKFEEILLILQNYDTQYRDVLTAEIIAQYEAKEIAALWNSSIEYSNRDIIELQNIDEFFQKIVEDATYEFAHADVKILREKTKSYILLIQQFQADSKEDISLDDMIEKLKSKSYKPLLEDLSTIQKITEHYTSLQREAQILENVEGLKLSGESALSEEEVQNAKNDTTKILAGYSGKDETYLLETLATLLESYAVISENDLTDTLEPLLAGNLIELDDKTAYLNIDNMKVDATNRFEQLTHIKTYYKDLDVADYSKEHLKTKRERILLEINLIEQLYKYLDNPINTKAELLDEGYQLYTESIKPYKEENELYMNEAE